VIKRASNQAERQVVRQTRSQMKRPRDIEAEITLFPTEHGGRQHPVSNDYRPQFYYAGHDCDAPGLKLSAEYRQLPRSERGTSSCAPGAGSSRSSLPPPPCPPGETLGEVFSKCYLTHFRDDEEREVSSRVECARAPLVRRAPARGVSAWSSKASRLASACPLRS